jgi:hypothetical protein
MKDFKHGALQNPDTSIRLLKIESDDDADEIRCSLSVAALDGFPEYTAFSYDWGEPDVLVDMFIDMEDFKRDIISVYYCRF